MIPSYLQKQIKFYPPNDLVHAHMVKATEKLSSTILLKSIFGMLSITMLS